MDVLIVLAGSGLAQGQNCTVQAMTAICTVQAMTAMSLPQLNFETSPSRRGH